MFKPYNPNALKNGKPVSDHMFMLEVHASTEVDDIGTGDCGPEIREIVRGHLSMRKAAESLSAYDGLRVVE